MSGWHETPIPLIRMARTPSRWDAAFVSFLGWRMGKQTEGRASCRFFAFEINRRKMFEKNELRSAMLIEP
jgi:hypothetical protein